jgi:hypothetical protein
VGTPTHRFDAPVRKLSQADAPLVGDLLAQAFTDDPPVAWWYPDPAERVEGMREFFTANARLCLQHGSGWLADDDAAVALWLEPGAVVDEAAADRAGLIEAITQMGGDRSEQAARFLEAIDALHRQAIPMPHHELFFLGAAPQSRGSGHAAALLDRLHEEHPGTWGLVTLNGWNVAWYRRRGYAVVCETTIEDSPLTAWVMQRG